MPPVRSDHGCRRSRWRGETRGCIRIERMYPLSDVRVRRFCQTFEKDSGMRDHEHFRSDLTGIVPYPLRVAASGDFEAWIENLAAKLRVPATVIFRDAGVRWVPDGNAIWMVRVDDEALARLAAFTSNTPEAINATLLGSWDGGPLDLTGLTPRNVRVFGGVVRVDEVLPGACGGGGVVAAVAAPARRRVCGGPLPS